jgi:hypothetical protein
LVVAWQTRVIAGLALDAGFGDGDVTFRLKCRAVASPGLPAGEHGRETTPSWN